MTSLLLSLSRGTLESDVVLMSATFLQIFPTLSRTSHPVIVSTYVTNAHLHNPWAKSTSTGILSDYRNTAERSRSTSWSKQVVTVWPADMQSLLDDQKDAGDERTSTESPHVSIPLLPRIHKKEDRERRWQLLDAVWDLRRVILPLRE